MIHSITLLSYLRLKLHDINIKHLFSLFSILNSLYFLFFYKTHDILHYFSELSKKNPQRSVYCSKRIFAMIYIILDLLLLSNLNREWCSENAFNFTKAYFISKTLY